MGKQYTRRLKNHENKYLDKNISKGEVNGINQLRREKPPNSEVLAPDEEEMKKKKKKKKETKKKKKLYIQFAQYTMSSLPSFLVTVNC